MYEQNIDLDTNRIALIKAVKTKTACSLHDAKKAVDRFYTEVEALKPTKHVVAQQIDTVLVNPNLTVTELREALVNLRDRIMKL